MKNSEVRETKFSTDNLRFLYQAPADEETLHSVLTKWSLVVSEYGKAINSNKETEAALKEMIELSNVLKQKWKDCCSG